MIPIFPSFKNLTLRDKTSVEKITSKYLPYSDYNFCSLWTYNVEEKVSIALLYDNLVVKFQDYLSERFFYSFLGTNEIVKTIEALLALSIQEKLIPELCLVPETDRLLDQQIKNYFRIVEDRDNFDYIISLSQLTDPASRVHYNKQKQVAIFKRTFPNYKIKKLDVRYDLVKKEIIDLCGLWKKHNDKSENDTKHEFLAIKRSLKNAESLDVVAIGVYYEMKLIGFAICDFSHKEYVEFHFIKADRQYKGIYAFLTTFFAEYAFKKGYKFLNMEQDLGIKSLREAKLQWHPTSFLKKYKISFLEK